MATIGKNLDRMVAKERISEGDKTATLANITTFTDMASGIQFCRFGSRSSYRKQGIEYSIFSGIWTATHQQGVFWLPTPLPLV